MRTDQIDRIARDILCQRVSWLGVFARDKIPELSGQSRPFALIFNSDPASEPGQHWLAIYGSRATKEIEFFDSYGRPPEFYSLTFDFPIRSSRHSIQSAGTSVCGQYCLLFLYYRACYRSFEHTIDVLRKSYRDPKKVAQTVNVLASTFTLKVPRNYSCIQCCSKKSVGNYF